MNLPRTMKAAALFAPNDLRIVEKPVPTPGPGEVLVKVAACAVCGTDLEIIGHGLPGQPPFNGTFTPGHEYAGTVVALGPTVDEFQVGDRVVVEVHKGCGRCENCRHGMYTSCLNYGNLDKGHRANGFTADGAYAEYAVNHVNTLNKIPDDMDFDEATLITTAGTALYGLDSLGGWIAGETIAVTGPGPIGLMGVQCAKALGATVILTGTRDSRLELGRKLGADYTVNVRNENPVEAVRRITGGKGADYVLECSGAPKAAQEAIEMAKRGGKICLAAFNKEPVLVDLAMAVRNNISLFGIRGEGKGNVGRGLALMAQGKIEGKSLITHRFKLDDVNLALKTFAERIGDAIKVIVNP